MLPKKHKHGLESILRDLAFSNMLRGEKNAAEKYIRRLLADERLIYDMIDELQLSGKYDELSQISDYARCAVANDK